MIRPARTEEAVHLTALSFQSKGYWSYPTEYFDIWKDELTITSQYVEKNDVFVYEKMGCRYCGEFSSSIPNRTTPLLECDCQAT